MQQLTRAERALRPPGKNAYVINEHRRRKYRGGAWISIERPADGEIEDQIERFAEHRLAVLLHGATRDRVMHVVVDEESHLDRIPLDRVPVELVGDVTPQHVGVRERCLPGVSRSVNGRARRVWLASLVLHHVDLAARRPRDGWMTFA